LEDLGDMNDIDFDEIDFATLHPNAPIKQDIRYIIESVQAETIELIRKGELGVMNGDFIHPD